MTDYDKESFLRTIMNLLNNFVSVGSGWNVHRVMFLSISFAPYWPMQGSSYIHTPNELFRKQVVLNIQNCDDNYCILYAILAHIHPAERNTHPELPEKYSKFMVKLSYEGLKFPLKITDVSKLEKMNPVISINVLFMRIAILFHFITALTETVKSREFTADNGWEKWNFSLFFNSKSISSCRCSYTCVSLLPVLL